MITNEKPVYDTKSLIIAVLRFEIAVESLCLADTSAVTFSMSFDDCTNMEWNIAGFSARSITFTKVSDY